MFIQLAAVGMGGFVGACARFLLSLIPMQSRGNYPINTFITNIIGAVLIGFIIAYAKDTDMDPNKLLLLKTGLCGGLTTFSTFSVEAWGLLESGSWIQGGLYIILSVVCCIAGVYVGLRLG